MTNDELDRLAAEKVMGAKVLPNPPGYVGCTAEPEDFYPSSSGWERVGKPYQPTRDIAQAWELLEKLKHLDPEISYDNEDEWACWFNKSTPGITYCCDTASEAIVRACLRAKGIEV